MTDKFSPLGIIAEDNQLQRVKILELGLEVVSAHLKAGEKYLALATYIRKEQVGKGLVKFELTRLGFAKSRISELWRVSSAPEETWLEYEARSLSFRDVLRLTRENVAQLGLLLGDAKEEAVPSKAKVESWEIHEEETRPGKKAKVPVKTRAAGLAASLLKLCPKLKSGSYWTDGKWIVSVAKHSTPATTET